MLLGPLVFCVGSQTIVLVDLVEARSEVLIQSFFFFQAEDGIRDYKVTGVQTCALPILEIAADADEAFVEMLTEAHDLEARDVSRVPGPIDLTALMALHRLDGFPALKDEPLVPRVAPLFAQGRDVFDVIRSQDVLVHLPYESFGGG